MEMSQEQIKPLILDFAEDFEVQYGEDGRQMTFAGTSQGTPEEPDSAGLDP